MPSTEARLGCAPLSSSMARPTFLMHGLLSLQGPARRLGQHADTALVGSGTTSDVAGGAGCVEQTLAANELLLNHQNHHASCTMQSRKTVPQPTSGLGQGGGLTLVINRDHDVLASATIHWNQAKAAENTGRSQQECKARCLNIGPCRTRGSDDQGQAQHGTRGEAQQPIEGRGCGRRLQVLNRFQTWTWTLGGVARLLGLHLHPGAGSMSSLRMAWSHLP